MSKKTVDAPAAEAAAHAETAEAAVRAGKIRQGKEPPASVSQETEAGRAAETAERVRDGDESIGPDQIAHAEREAAEAAALVGALEERVRDGDESIGPDQIEAARKLGAFARLRAEATRRKAVRAKAAHRQAQLHALAERLRAHDGDPAAFDTALTNLEEALETLAAMCDARREHIAAYRREMAALDVAPGSRDVYYGRGRAEDAGLAYSVASGAGIGVDGRILRTVDAGLLISVAVSAVDARHHLGLTGQELRALIGLDGRPVDLHELLRAQASMPAPALPEAGTRFFRHADSGAVLVLGAEALAEQVAAVGQANGKPATSYAPSVYQRQIDAGELIEITREEAGIR